MTYTEWFLQQPLEINVASQTHMSICRQLGDAQRRAPFSEEATTLRKQVSKYYASRGAEQ